MPNQILWSAHVRGALNLPLTCGAAGWGSTLKGPGQHRHRSVDNALWRLLVSLPSPQPLLPSGRRRPYAPLPIWLHHVCAFCRRGYAVSPIEFNTRCLDSRLLEIDYRLNDNGAQLPSPGVADRVRPRYCLHRAAALTAGSLSICA